MSGRPFYAGATLIAGICALTAACGKRTTARTPAAPKPAPIGWTQTGVASWYGVPYDGRHTSSGEVFDMRAMTAAHRKLPFNTWLEVTNLGNGKKVDVRINDRGPYARGRIIDLSMGAAQRLDMLVEGVQKVRLKVIRPPVSAAGAAAPSAPGGAGR